MRRNVCEDRWVVTETGVGWWTLLKISHPSPYDTYTQKGTAASYKIGGGVVASLSIKGSSLNFIVFDTGIARV